MKNDNNLIYQDGNRNFKSVLIVYSNPDEKDTICTSLFELTKSQLKSKNIKFSVLEIEKIEFISKKAVSDNNSNENKKTNNSNSVNNNSNNSISLNNLSSQPPFNISENDKNISLKKIDEADLVVFIFPVTWGSCPSRMKIWSEICYNDGIGYSLDNNQIYSNGKMKGKFAVVVCTTENSKKDYGYKGKFILSLDEILEHFTHGVLALYGYSVLPNFVIYKENEDIIRLNLDQYPKFVDQIETTEVLYNQ